MSVWNACVVLCVCVCAGVCMQVCGPYFFDGIDMPCGQVRVIWVLWRGSSPSVVYVSLGCVGVRLLQGWEMSTVVCCVSGLQTV